MTSGAVRNDDIEKRIAVAINAYFVHAHTVPALLALFPNLLSGTREEVRVASFQGQFVRLIVCVRKHEHLSGVFVLNDDRYKAVCAEVRHKYREVYRVHVSFLLVVSVVSCCIVRHTHQR